MNPPKPGPALALWYETPASDWERETLPIGNGHCGASIFGGLDIERVQLNEKTLWTGGPGAPGWDHGDPPPDQPPGEAWDRVRARIDAAGTLPPETVVRELGRPKAGYGDYQPLAELRLALPEPGTAAGYRRELDLTEAVARVRYTAGGATHHREFFASHPDAVLVGRLTADRPAAVTVTVTLAAPPAGAEVTAADGELLLRGAFAGNGLRYEARVRVLAEGGTVTAAGAAVTVAGADAVTLLVAAGTDYAPVHPHYRGADPAARVATTVAEAADRSYAELRARHVADHRNLFDRMTLDIGQGDRPPAVPTDTLLAGYGGGGAADRWLEALYLAYGRYLLIASSRPGSLPANLQGVWNNQTSPPWNSDYHPNINLQMVYWPAEVTHLAETARPLHDFIDALRPPGRISAARMFGTEGWVVQNETNPFGFTGVHDWSTSFWFPEAAAWLTRHLWEHYLYTGDREFLWERAYPVMREAAQLWLAILRPDPRDGALVATPSYSPEHGDFTAGAAMSQQIVTDLLTNLLAAATLLDVDESLRARLHDVLTRLDPGLRIGSWGQLQEWKADLDDPANTHRHVSHLYALHPGDRLDPLTDPELAAAARVTLDARGDGGTGWSKAWKISFWARLRDGDRAHRLLAGLLRESTLPNLWDTHPPFQLDGNLGAVAGVAEMLLQSQHGVIDILPALPAAWPTGAVSGLRARGAVTVGIRWRDRAAVAFELAPDRSGPLRVRCPLLDSVPLRDVTSGAAVVVRDGGFLAEAGHVYRCG